MNGRIHVQIPAYMDRELEPTLRDLYAQARWPDRLRVSVLWQTRTRTDLSAETRALPNLDLVRCDAAESCGPNWARSQLRDRWSGEEFTLMLDSHHRFVPGWDEIVTRLYRDAAEGSPSPAVLTAYLPPYLPERPMHPRPREPLRLLPYVWDQGLLTRLVGYPIPFASQRSSALPGALASFHFLFGPGEINECSGLDLLDDIYFFGDEVLLALLLQSAGYRLHHPHLLVGWHAYERGAREPHWQSDELWSERHETSLDLIRAAIEAAGQPGAPITREAVAMIETDIMAPLLTY